MSEFFQLFQPGLRHLQEQRDLDKVLVVDQKKGGSGPQPLDLDSGKVVLRMPTSTRDHPGEADETPSGGDGGSRPAEGGTYTAAMDSPLPPVPDDKDWTVVLTRKCAECGYDASKVDTRDLAELVREAAAPWEAVLARRDVTQRPAPQVWSPLEYGCHVRDVLGVFTDRLTLMLEQEDPTFANWDQDATAIAERYWEQEPATVADEILSAAEANASLWERVGDADWQRPGLRSNGSRFTVDTLGRYLLHDLRHHLWDVSA